MIYPFLVNLVMYKHDGKVAVLRPLRRLAWS